jgi:uncharacterized protein
MRQSNGIALLAAGRNICGFGLARLLLVLCCLACVSAHAEPSLWSVEDPKTKARLYLFGSIHFGVETLYPLPKHVTRAFSQSDALAVELDLSSIDSSEASKVLHSVGRLPDGGRIRDQLTENAWQSLNRVARSLELPVESLERFQPWLIAVQLTAAQVRRSGFSEGYGVDRYFLTLAKHPLAPKPIIQLETFEQQMSLFGGLSPAQQALFLEQTLLELEFAENMLGSIIEAWNAGDEIELETLITDAFLTDGSEQLYERIFVQRNQRMEIRLVQSLEEQETLFVVVGAGHIIGPDGLKQRFVDRGYIVEQVESDGLF